jgi:hypothetical protein
MENKNFSKMAQKQVFDVRKKYPLLWTQINRTNMELWRKSKRHIGQYQDYQFICNECPRKRGQGKKGNDSIQ